ncbi:hypothetical protein KY492_00580 [Brevibacterium sp. PAMC21349]|nr:hypothetical protein KY492_00580 [Brevibacterium sp. PAMC21349]
MGSRGRVPLVGLGKAQINNERGNYMFYVNLINRAYLESELDRHGILDLAEELIERLIEHVSLNDIYERVFIYAVSVVNEVYKKVHTQFNILENEDEEEQLRKVEFEVLTLSE